LADFAVVAFFAVEARFVVERFALAEPVGAVSARVTVAGAPPVDTRDECFVRWRTCFLGAASATVVNAKAVTRVTSIMRIEVRIIDNLQGEGAARREYDSRSAARSRPFLLGPHAL
jgi:hypothetical protein